MLNKFFINWVRLKIIKGDIFLYVGVEVIFMNIEGFIDNF